MLKEAKFPFNPVCSLRNEKIPGLKSAKRRSGIWRHGSFFVSFVIVKYLSYPMKIVRFFHLFHTNAGMQTRKLFFVLLFLLGGLWQGYAQDIDVQSLVRERHISCHDLAFSASSLIPEYYHLRETDTLEALVYFWEISCGTNEPIFRFKTLQKIENNTFHEGWYPDNFWQLIHDYRQKIEEDTYQHFYFDYEAWEYYETHQGFNEFTATLAGNLKDDKDPEPLEKFYLELYANEFDKAFSLLEEGKLEGTRLDSVYRHEQEAKRRESFVFGGIYGGLWRPSDQLTVIGNQAQMGFMFGTVRNRTLYNISFQIGFLSSQEVYTVVVDNMLYETDHYTGYFIGFETGYDLLNARNRGLFLTGGIGYEGFDAFSEFDQAEYGLSRTLHTLNLNIGTQYRIQFSENGFLSLVLRHNILFYNNRGGTDLSGNALTFGLLLGYGQLR